MTSLRPPGLGPIVGHTTDTTCRLWIRAGDPEDEGAHLSSERRTIGVGAVMRKGGRKVTQPPAFYFRLHREFDRTGTFALGLEASEGKKGGGSNGGVYRLDPETEYMVRLGTLTLDDPYRDDIIIEDDVLVKRLPEPEAWITDLEKLPDKKSEAVFRTFPVGEVAAKQLSFLLGSCRYPGILWKVKLADRIFGPMADQVSDGAKQPAPRMVLMVGDQIYADMLSRYVPLGLADTYEEFQERYLTAFGSPNMRRLLRQAPTYMILDDHEIEDNWSQDRLRQRDKRLLFNIAINAYMSYQWSHSPRTFGKHLHYRFDCAGYPFFTIDTRTQRVKDDIEGELRDNHLLGRPALHPEAPTQLSLLLDWLQDMQKKRGNVPKFIVSSTVFVPNPMSARQGMSAARLDESDAWPAFPATRRALLQCILDHRIQNVVFLSGDIHCSNIAEIYFRGTPEAEQIKAFSITSSAFYWPFPFADGNPNDFVHDSRGSGQEDSFEVYPGGVTMDYRAWNFTQEDNFCRIGVDKPKAEIRVTAFNYDGEIIVEAGVRGKRRRMVGTLKLVPWE